MILIASLVGVGLVGMITGVSVAPKLKKKYPKLHSRMCIGCGIPPTDGEDE